MRMALEQREMAHDGENNEDETCDASDLVEKTATGYKLSMHDIPSVLFGSIVGCEGKTVEQIELDTSTYIDIPGRGKDGPIVITGPQESGVVSARKRIKVIAESAREKKPYTHFLSFPLYNDKLLVDRFEVFKNTVLKKCGQCNGVEPSIFQNSSKLHQTIGMLKLLNKTEVEKASNFLSSCYQELVSEILANYTPLEVHLRGVDCMPKDDPTQVDVLHMKVVDGSDRLQRLADALFDRFLREDLIIKPVNYEHVELHVTVMNKKFRKDTSMPAETSRTQRKKNVPFDAKDIVEMFKDFDFGTYRLDSIHLSQRGKFDSAGHYFCAASVQLP